MNRSAPAAGVEAVAAVVCTGSADLAGDLPSATAPLFGDAVEEIFASDFSDGSSVEAGSEADWPTFGCPVASAVGAVCGALLAAAVAAGLVGAVAGPLRQPERIASPIARTARL